MQDSPESYAKIGESQKALGILKNATDVADSIQDDLKKRNSTQDDLKKYSALRRIAESYAKIGESQKALGILKNATDVAVKMHDEYRKFPVLREIAESYAKLGYWRRARQAAEMNNNDADKIQTYCIILRVWAERKNPNLQDMEF